MELRGNSTKALLLAGANTLVRGWLYHKTADAGWKQVYCVPESVQGAEQVGAAPQLSLLGSGKPFARKRFAVSAPT